MPKTSKIAISLPEEVLTAVEREREESGESRSQIFRRAVDLLLRQRKEREESGESRSQIFRRALELLLRQRKEREMSEQYIQAYQRIPETEEEVTAARRAASAILAGEPW